MPDVIGSSGWTHIKAEIAGVFARIAKSGHQIRD
jgi:hypothetical protein